MMIIPKPKAGIVVLLVLACGAALYTDISKSTAKSPPPQAACADLLAYGADPSGRRDNAAAFRAAVAAGDPNALCVHVPTGIYRFTSAATVSAGKAPDAAVAITGDGAGLSRLSFDAGVDGLAIRLNGPLQSFGIRGLSILASGNRGNTTGLSVIQSGSSAPNPAPSEISGVVVRGRDGYAAHDGFARGVHLRQVSNATLANVTIVGNPGGAPYATNGICLLVEGTAAAIPIQINIIASQINYCGRGLVYGPYLQGVQIAASNFTGNGIAIYQPGGNVGNDQLAITASQFNSGFHDILLESPIDGVTIAANHFYLAEGGAAAIAMRGVQFAIQGNTFHQFGKPRAAAIAVGSFLLDAGAVAGNSFNNFFNAIRLEPGSSRVTVQGNAYSDIASDRVLDRGTGNRVKSEIP